MPKIFVSYRRVDSEERAHRIADWLILKYGIENVFIDVDTIGGGDDFANAIISSLNESDVVLVVIGNEWVDELVKRTQSNKLDFVHLEVSKSLTDNLLVIPVLLDRQVQIDANRLPADVRGIVKRNYMYARLTDFHQDLERIRTKIDKEFAPQPQSRIPFVPILIGVMILAIIIFGGLALSNNIGAEQSITPTVDNQTIADEPTETLTITPTQIPTDEPTIIPSNTIIPVNTLAPTETTDVVEAAQALITQQAAQKIVDDTTATAQQQILEIQQTAIQQANETATATVWTKTPTADITASVAALLTEWADGTMTQQILDLTATATLWTATPTVTFTPTITDTATAYPILDELPSGVAVSLLYNQTQFAIRNNSEGAVVFSEMRLSGIADEGVGEFDGATLPVIALLPGECILIHSETEPFLDEWGCTKVRSSIELQTPARFWFADNSDDTGFRVFWRSNEIKTCNTVGRAVSRTEVLCDIEWPIFTGG